MASCVYACRSNFAKAAPPGEKTRWGQHSLPSPRHWLAFAAMAVSLGATAVEARRAYPSPLAFFNALAGGPRQGSTYLVDSNLDWGQDLKALKRYHFANGSVMGLVKYTAFRSGYTGEDGLELILPAKMAGMAMKMLGGKFDKPDATIKPAGLGARDTLRLEAGMPLYGHELNENIDPISAGLGWAVDLTKDFIGVERLRQIKEQGPARKLVGLELDGKRIARQGMPVKSNDGAAIGEITSGTLSPTLGKSIAMGFIDANLAGEGTAVQVDLKGTLNAAKVVKLPFYKRAS